MKMIVTPFGRIIQGKLGALVYHSLKGNLFFLEPEYARVIKNFGKLSKAQKDSKPQIISDLIDAGYIISSGIDEREFIRQKNAKWMAKVAGGGQLRLLNLMISEACNFGCQHCLHKCSVQTDFTHGKKRIMSWELARRAIDKYASILANSGSQNLNIHFGSAEPLLNWQVLKKSVQYSRSLDPEAKLAVNTNLSLITQTKAEFLRDNSVYISTSLDGPVQGNDLIRTFPDGSGTYKTIISKFKMLSAIGYPLDGFSITINDLNFDLVDPEFIAWAKGQGFQGIATDIDLINVRNSRRSVEDCANKLLSLRDACQRLELENFGSWTTAYDNLVNEPEDEMPTFCKAVKGRNISINPSGLIFVCGHTNTCLGSVDNFSDIFEAGSEYCNFIESRLPGNDPSCYDCELEGVCAGQCQITREVSKNTKNNRDRILCDFYREVTRRLLEKKLIAETGGN